MSDSVLRAITDSGAFRVIVARTTQTVRAASAAQQVTGIAARQLGDLMTSGVLFRELMAPTLRVQVLAQGAAGAGRVVADSWPDGGSRGLVQSGPAGLGVTGGNGASLRVSRERPRGGLQEGIVELAAGSGAISEALMRYLQESEQVVAAIATGSVFENDELVAAGGWVVQLLPEAEASSLAIMTERLADIEPIDSLLLKTLTPSAMVEELLYGWPWTPLEESALSFRCRCTQASVQAAVATLPEEDLAEILADGEPLEIRCDYCRVAYQLSMDVVRGMLSARGSVH